jgi:hypothetical protein
LEIADNVTKRPFYSNSKTMNISNRSNSSGSTQALLKPIAEAACLATKDFISTLHQLRADIPDLPLKLLQRRLERIGGAAELALQQQQQQEHNKPEQECLQPSSAGSGVPVPTADSSSSFDPMEDQEEAEPCKHSHAQRHHLHRQQQQQQMHSHQEAEQQQGSVSCGPGAMDYQPISGKLSDFNVWMLSKGLRAPQAVLAAIEQVQETEEEPAAAGRLFGHQQQVSSGTAGVPCGAVAEQLAWLVVLHSARELRWRLSEWAEKLVEFSGLQLPKQHPSRLQPGQQQQQTDFMACSGASADAEADGTGELEGNGIAWWQQAGKCELNCFKRKLLDLLSHLDSNEQCCQLAGVEECFVEHREMYQSWWTEKVFECIPQLLTLPCRREQDQEECAAAATAAAGAAKAAAGACAVADYDASVRWRGCWLSSVGAIVWKGSGLLVLLVLSLRLLDFGIMAVAQQLSAMAVVVKWGFQTAALAGDGRGGLWAGPGWAMSTQARHFFANRKLQRYLYHLCAAEIFHARWSSMLEKEFVQVTVQEESGLGLGACSRSALIAYRDDLLEHMLAMGDMKEDPVYIAVKHWQLQEPSAAAESGLVASAKAAVSVKEWEPSTDQVFLEAYAKAEALLEQEIRQTFGVLLRYLPAVEGQLVQSCISEQVGGTERLSNVRVGPKGPQAAQGAQPRQQKAPAQKGREQNASRPHAGAHALGADTSSKSSAMGVFSGDLGGGPNIHSCAASMSESKSTSSHLTLSNGSCKDSSSSSFEAISTSSSAGSSCISAISNGLLAAANTGARIAAERLGLSWGLGPTHDLAVHTLNHLALHLVRTAMLVCEAEAKADLKAGQDGVEGAWEGKSVWQEVVERQGSNVVAKCLAVGAADIVSKGAVLGPVDNQPALQALQALSEEVQGAAAAELGAKSLRRLEPRVAALAKQLQGLHKAGRCSLAQQLLSWTSQLGRQGARLYAGELQDMDAFIKYVVSSLGLLGYPGFLDCEELHSAARLGVQLCPELVMLAADLASAVSSSARRSAATSSLLSPPPVAASPVEVAAAGAVAPGEATPSEQVSGVAAASSADSAMSRASTAAELSTAVTQPCFCCSHGSAEQAHGSSASNQPVASPRQGEHSCHVEGMYTAADIDRIVEQHGFLKVAPGEYVRLMGAPPQSVQQQQSPTQQEQQPDEVLMTPSAFAPPPTPPIHSPPGTADLPPTVFRECKASLAPDPAAAAAAAEAGMLEQPLLKVDLMPTIFQETPGTPEKGVGSTRTAKSQGTCAAPVSSAAALAKGLLGLWKAAETLPAKVNAVKALTKQFATAEQHYRVFEELFEQSRPQKPRSVGHKQQKVTVAPQWLEEQRKCAEEYIFAGNAVDLARWGLRQELAGLAFARQQIRQALDSRCAAAHPPSSKLWDVESDLYIHRSKSSSSSRREEKQWQWLEGNTAVLVDCRGAAGSGSCMECTSSEGGVFQCAGVACNVVPGPLGAAIPELLLQGLVAKEPSQLPDRIRRAAAEDKYEVDTDSAYFEPEYDQIMQEEVQLGVQQQQACMFAAVQLLLRAGLLAATWSGPALTSTPEHSSRSHNSTGPTSKSSCCCLVDSAAPLRGEASASLCTQLKQSSSSIASGVLKGPCSATCVESSSSSSGLHNAPGSASLQSRLAMASHKGEFLQQEQQEIPRVSGFKEVLLGILKWSAEDQLQVQAGQVELAVYLSGSVRCNQYVAKINLKRFLYCADCMLFAQESH